MNEVLSSLLPVKLDVDNLCDRLTGMTIESQADLTIVVGNLATLKQYRVRCENAQKTLVKPLQEHIKFINGEIAKTTDKIDEIVELTGKKILDYRKIQEATRLSEESRIKELTGIQTLELPKQKTYQAENASVTFRTNWKWRLLDLDKVPNEYKIPVQLDEIKINKAVGAGARSISGLEIYPEESVAIKGGKK